MLSSAIPTDEGWPGSKSTLIRTLQRLQRKVHLISQLREVDLDISLNDQRSHLIRGNLMRLCFLPAGVTTIDKANQEVPQ